MKHASLMLAVALSLLLAPMCPAQETAGKEVANENPNGDAKEATQKQVDPSGAWRWKYDWQGETIENMLRLNVEKDGQVVGTFHGRDKANAVEIKNGQIKGDQLSISVPLDFNGYKMDLDFNGRVKDDGIDGVVDVQTADGSQEFPWTPKRSVQLADVVGVWQIRIEGPNGNVFEPVLKISEEGDDFAAEYTSRRGDELEVKDLRVEKNYLLFTVTAEFDGNRLQVDYKGRPYGEKMSGDLEYDFSGNAGQGQFVAKRKVEKKKTEAKETAREKPESEKAEAAAAADQ